MVKSVYVPERGDVVWIDLEGAKGHEQSGRRPAIIVSPIGYNQKTGLALACPITSRVKNYTYEVFLQSTTVEGAILADHVRNIDWKVRKAKFIEKAEPTVINDVEAKLLTLVEN